MNWLLNILFISSLFLISCSVSVVNDSGTNNYEKKKYLNLKDAPAAIGPYSHAIIVGNRLYISGQIGINPKSGELTDGFENELKMIMDNLETILKSENFSFKNIVQANIYLKDINNYKLLNEIYSNYFEENFPTRTVVEVSNLPKNANIEITIIAEK